MHCQLRVTVDIYLRLLDPADAPELYSLIEANRPYLSEWIPWAAGQTLEGTVEFIRRARGQLADNNGFQAAILNGEQIIGVIGYHAVDWANRMTSIGYWLDRGKQGMGTMTESVRVLVDHALSVWELNRVEIRAAADNHRSRAIPERLGFHPEGTLRQRELLSGRFCDCVLYSMLSADWRASG
jgi:ribosomal-protein-serine acetyltransferase